MKLKSPLMFLILLGLVRLGYANNDKYRLILLDDPATTITVAWNQISGSNASVYYDTIDHGTDFSAYAFNKTVDRETSAKGMTNQFARLSGLLPNTNYYFLINDSEGVSQQFWFRTAPDDDSRLFFIAGGDSRNNRTPRQNANKLVSKLKPHAVLFGGDMTNADSDSEWQDWFEDWQLTTAADGRMFPIVPARGNHENTSSIYDLFDTPNADSYYAMTWGNNMIRTYTLNSEISVLGDQLTWLEDDLNTSSYLTWKMAQYHKPMRPHTSGKSEGNAQYGAWAQLFYDQQVRLVVDCDSHMAKTTWPIKPSSDPGNDEGFVIEEQAGTVYTGEGCWGAPLRDNDDDKSWTRNSGSFNQFKLVFVDNEKIELRTIDVNNADEVAEGSNTDPFTLPEALNIFSPETGSVVTISNSNIDDNPCPVVGITCDDENATTLYDEEDGFCNCEGVPDFELVEETIAVQNSSDDAEEEIGTGLVYTESTDLELIYDDIDQLVGIRFENVQIPQGATLYRSYIQFQTDETSTESDVTNLIINGELSLASETFTSNNNDISVRPLTVSAVNWNDVAQWETVGEAGVNQRTPYLNNVVYELISQTGWEVGNAMTFILSGSGVRIAESFDGSAAPELKLFYQLPCNPEGTTCDDGNPNTVLDFEDGNCNCIGVEESGTLNYQINHEDDDAEEAEAGGAMYTDSSDLEMVYDAFEDQFNQTVGMRFNGVTLPQGAVILDAAIQFTTDESNSVATNLVIKGEKAINSLRFTTEAYNITSREKTDAAVTWSDVPAWETVGEAGENQKTPSLRTIVQEIVDQPDWLPYSSMSFFISGSGERTAESFNGDSGAAPQLIITYSLESNDCPTYGTPCDDGDASTIDDEEDGFCNCNGIPDDVVEAINEVLNSSDDAEEEIGTGLVYTESSDLELVYDGIDQVIGVRFDNVQMPEGAVLSRAYLQFQTDETSADADITNLMINGELATESGTFTSNLNDITSRDLTMSSVNWNDVAMWNTTGEAGLNQRSPYVTNIVEEIIAQDGWLSGNAVTFIISGSGKRVAESFDGAAAPILKLYYQTPCEPDGTSCDDGNADTFFDVEDGNCNCEGILETGTLIYEVNRSNNDAEEEVATGAMDLGSSDLELVDESGSTNQLVGVRFTDIQLPSDAVITNAYIQFTVDDDNSDPTSVEIRAEANAYSLEFSNTDFDISFRTLGNNVVSWNDIPAWDTENIGDAGVNQQTPNIASLVEEILAQDNWTMFNAMTFVINGSGEREAEAFDGSAGPQLVIEYALSSLSVKDESLGDAISIYPNPVADVLNIESTVVIDKITIYDVNGRRINTLINNNNSTINVDDLSNGVYFLEIQSGINKMIKRFIKS
ncbi:T9SS type A sorting domain-containing protein [Winogradskyella costae]|uniref:T9SS type A sorting domain-containing protein n=1 Tax=Winogradskyella costae TaxID=2697008 RepID=UPI0015CA227B|nr:T9SS type A sorting domain-containing protein [Winogradskyella costae]